MLFVSDRPSAGEDETANRFYRIWFARRTDAGWSEPELFPVNIRNNIGIYFASVASNGNLYYTTLNEATASLDEPSEAALYQLLTDRLPATTIVSIGHRSTLEAFHQRGVTLAHDGDRFALRDAGDSVKAS